MTITLYQRSYLPATVAVDWLLCPCRCCCCCQVLTLAGELLGNAEVLLRDGLHTSEIADGYQRASEKVRNLKVVPVS
jgi:hypothetical protein